MTSEATTLLRVVFVIGTVFGTLVTTAVGGTLLLLRQSDCRPARTYTVEWYPFIRADGTWETRK